MGKMAGKVHIYEQQKNKWKSCVLIIVYTVNPDSGHISDLFEIPQYCNTPSPIFRNLPSHHLALWLVLAPVLAEALHAAESSDAATRGTARAHLELLLVVKLRAVLVATGNPELTNGGVWECSKDIWWGSFWGQAGSREAAASQFVKNLFDKLFSTALENGIICGSKIPDEGPVDVLLLCWEQWMQVSWVARETLENAANLRFAVGFEDLR